MAGRRLISGRQALAVEMDMRQGLYAHLVRLSFGFYDRHQTGQLMSRATVDLQGVRFFLGYGLIFFFQNAITVISVTVVLLVFEWKLALIALAITPVLVVVAYRYSHVTHPTLREVQQKLADVATVAEENIVGVHVVKSFAQEPQESAKFHARSEAVFEQTVKREPAARALRAVHLLDAAARAGRGAARGRADGDERRADRRRLRRLQPLPRHARGAAALARDVDRPGPARDRLGRADLPGDGRAGGDRRAARRRRAAAGRRRPALRGRALRVPRRAAGARRRDARRSRRPDDRADRADRLRQDDPDLARAALLRRDRRPRAGRRRRRARRDADLAPARDRRDLAGSVPVLGERPREHHLRRAGPRRRGGRADRAAGPGARVRRASCPTATTRSSASAGSRSRAASASGWRSRARSRSTRGS